MEWNIYRDIYLDAIRGEVNERWSEWEVDREVSRLRDIC